MQLLIWIPLNIANDDGLAGICIAFVLSAFNSITTVRLACLQLCFKKKRRNKRRKQKLDER